MQNITKDLMFVLSVLEERKSYLTNGWKFSKFDTSHKPTDLWSWVNKTKTPENGQREIMHYLHGGND